MPIESLAFNSKEKISWLNGSRIYGISLSYDIAIVAPRCGYEFSNSRERQLHEFFPGAAVVARQSLPPARVISNPADHISTKNMANRPTLAIFNALPRHPTPCL